MWLLFWEGPVTFALLRLDTLPASSGPTIPGAPDYGFVYAPRVVSSCLIHNDNLNGHLVVTEFIPPFHFIAFRLKACSHVWALSLSSLVFSGLSEKSSRETCSAPPPISTLCVGNTRKALLLVNWGQTPFGCCYG